MRNAFYKLPVLGMIVLAAACGGGDKPAETTNDTPQGSAADVTPQGSSGTATVTTDAPNTSATTAPAQGTVHTVRMTTTQGGASGQFEPANITVKKGDVIHFVSEGNAAHNVSFPADQNAGKSNLPAPSQYLTNGQSYDLQVTLDPGSYKIQCDPHAAMGMVAAITVQ
ncbi:MAG TPA: plastocyanin/azurin family copper-binding protein [Longimicrobium sp.]|jgi:plastocyanin